MASCCLGSYFLVCVVCFGFFKINGRATEYYRSATWRHKEPHSKVKIIFLLLLLLVMDISWSSVYFYFSSVFLAGLIQDGNPEWAVFFRVSISLFLHFQNSHIKHFPPQALPPLPHTLLDKWASGLVTALQCD